MAEEINGSLIQPLEEKIGPLIASMNHTYIFETTHEIRVLVVWNWISLWITISRFELILCRKTLLVHAQDQGILWEKWTFS